MNLQTNLYLQPEQKWKMVTTKTIITIVLLKWLGCLCVSVTLTCWVTDRSVGKVFFLTKSFWENMFLQMLQNFGSDMQKSFCLSVYWKLLMLSFSPTKAVFCVRFMDLYRQYQFRSAKHWNMQEGTLSGTKMAAASLLQKGPGLWALFLWFEQNGEQILTWNIFIFQWNRDLSSCGAFWQWYHECK